MQTVIRLLLLALLFQGLLAAGCASKKERPITALSPEYVDAQEFKLKIRELADQMLATTANSALNGLVAMPTSFVDLTNKRETSPLGNLMAESLIYEFNQRGFPVREYHLTGGIEAVLGKGDFSLLRQGLVSTKGQKWAALIVGTYYRDKDAIFVNARLVRAQDGMVLRSAQLVLPNSGIVARLSAPPPPPLPATAALEPSPRKAGISTDTGLSSGAMTIVPAPWKSTPNSGRTKSAGAGLWSAPQQ